MLSSFAINTTNNADSANIDSYFSNYFLVFLRFQYFFTTFAIKIHNSVKTIS